MEATDITWGGESKCEFKVLGKMPVIQNGLVIKLTYDHVLNNYSMWIESDEYTVVPTNLTNKAILEEYVRDSGWRANLIRIIDVQESNVSVQIHIFFQIIEFNSIQKLLIQISDNIINNHAFPNYAKSDPVKFISNEFIYNKNIVFAYNFKSKVKLQLISKTWRLDIDKRGNGFIASSIRRRKAEDINVPIYMLRGNIEFIDSTQNEIVSKEVAQKLQAISNPDSYFEIWNAYNELEKYFLLKQAIEDGIAQYSSYEVEIQDAFVYKFKLVDCDLENFIGEDVQIDCTDDEAILKVDKWEDLSEMKEFKKITIGKFSKISHNTLYVVDENENAKKKLPKSGYLFKSISGDDARIKRREVARDVIAKGLAPMPNLALLIDQGTSTTKQVRNEQAITNRLIKNMKSNLGKTVEFNIGQKKAIEIALNTPDIALIQGPPGTGKTTVIKAIITRFEEYYHKNYDGETPTILVSSFQHVAVDNAISNMNPSGLPANRLGGKQGEESKEQATILSWSIKENKRCSDIIKTFESSHIFDKLNMIKDECYAWYSKCKNLLDGIDLLKRIKQKQGFELSRATRDRIEEVIAKTIVIGESSEKLKQIDENNTKEFLRLINRQRTNIASFNDDGLRNALELKYSIESGLVKDQSIPECLLNVIKTKGTDSKAMQMYKDFVKSLQDKYSASSQITANKPVSSTDIEYCIDASLKELQYALLKQHSNRDEAKAQILQKYINSIADESVAKRIINTYSNIRAATCQQAMQLGRNATNDIYDLVIVDEAARANPLDLFIPMSMGKQVILVGDHIQLPHLLDDEVVRRLDQDHKFEELNTLKKSLFERLFEIFEEKKISSGINRTCTLDVQYRMHPVINDFVSDAFYNGVLHCGLSEQERTLNLNLYNNKPIVWLEANKQNYGIESKGRSKEREKEAEYVVENALMVLRADPDIKIGIITFYAKQEALLEIISERKMTSDEKSRINIGTVDSFQGKEFDVVFLSCVRANNEKVDDLKKRVGFINDKNRLCVSLSRAKSLLVVVGDSETVCIVPYLNNLLKLCKEGKGEYIIA